MPQERLLWNLLSKDHRERNLLMNDHLHVAQTNAGLPSPPARQGQGTTGTASQSLQLSSLISLSGAFLLGSALWLPWVGYASIRGYDLLTALIADPYAEPFLPGIWAAVVYLAVVGYLLLTSGMTLARLRLHPSLALDLSTLAAGVLAWGFILWFFKGPALPGYWFAVPGFLLSLGGTLWRVRRATTPEALPLQTPKSRGLKPFPQGLLLGGFLPVGLGVLIGWFLLALGNPPPFEVWGTLLGCLYLACWVGLILLSTMSKQQRHRTLAKGMMVGFGVFTGVMICLGLCGFIYLIMLFSNG